MGFSENLRKLIENSRFCYARDGGEGFVDKNECPCDSNRTCHAYQDKKRFGERFEEVGKDLGYEYPEVIKVRKEILETIKPEFEDSQWFKDNVVE